MDFIKSDVVYRPVVHDGVLNTFINSPNAYQTAVEAVIEAIHFAEVYNDDMYGGKISWVDSELTRGTRNYLRILSGTLDESTSDTFFIEIQKLQNNGKVSVVNKSRANEVLREQKAEMISSLAHNIEQKYDEIL